MANLARAFKIGDVVQIIPECFELTGLDPEASGELTVDEYGERWNGRYTVEAVDSHGNRYNIMESELRFIR
jgi:hypothetical protein